MINYQHPTRSFASANRSVTLTQGQSVSLGSGRITSAPGPIMNSMIEGFRANDPETLACYFRILANHGHIERTTPFSPLERAWLEAERHPHQ